MIYELNPVELGSLTLEFKFSYLQSSYLKIKQSADEIAAVGREPKEKIIKRTKKIGNGRSDSRAGF